MGLSFFFRVTATLENHMGPRFPFFRTFHIRTHRHYADLVTFLYEKSHTMLGKTPPNFGGGISSPLEDTGSNEPKNGFHGIFS